MTEALAAVLFRGSNPMKAGKRLVAALVFLAAAAAAAAAPPPPADKALTATGTVTAVQASSRTVEVTLSDGTAARFVWSSETKINGVLTPGARVTIRYETGADGKHLALQITVARG